MQRHPQNGASRSPETTAIYAAKFEPPRQNIHAPRERSTIYRAWIPDELLEALEDFLDEAAAKTPVGQNLFPVTTTTQEVNAALGAAALGVAATTYTFRRAYIRRMANYCLLDDGTVDLDRLKHTQCTTTPVCCERTTCLR